MTLTVTIKQSFEDAEKRKRDVEEEERKADPLSQLVTTFCRGAMTERSGALQEDPLYMAYAQIVAKSCGEEAEEDEEEGDEKTRVHVCVLKWLSRVNREVFFVNHLNK